MTHPPSIAEPPVPRPRRPEGGRGRAAAPRGFTLVELMVVVAIMLVLIGLTSAAFISARSNQKRLGTQARIGQFGAILAQQFASYATRDVPTAATPAARAAELRRLATGDLPDRWVDVKFMADNSAQFTSPQQRAYIAVWTSMTTKPTNAFAGAECLFMIIMRGGIADCLDCRELAADGRIGDKDGDGAFEFWDEWDRPIGYLLWPAAIQLPPGGGTRFFSDSPPFLPGASGETMRPLVYSAGADGLDPGSNGDFGFRCDSGTGHLAQGVNCGNPTAAPAAQCGAPSVGVFDNLTNLDDEAKQ